MEAQPVAANSEEFDLRQHFMYVWLLQLCTTRYSPTGAEMTIDLKYGDLIPNLSAEHLADLVGFINVSDYFPVATALVNLSIEGVAVTEVSIDFNRGQVDLILPSPQNYDTINQLESVLDRQTSVDFTFMVQVNRGESQ